MATAESKAFAKQLVMEKLNGAGGVWPRLREENVKAGLIERVDDPDLMYQSASNVCGMASFAHDLVETDPVLYVWLAIYLFKQGSGKLGRGAEGMVVTASPETRNSPLPNEMNHADWVVMASLRDHSNKVLHYAYNAKIPILGDIPILGLISNLIAEPVAGINWPGDLVALWKAAGFTKIVNCADVTALGGYNNLIRSGEYWAAGYQVMWLIRNIMLNGGSGGPPVAQHWVTLESTVEEDLWAFKGQQESRGVNFTIFNPARRERYRVPAKPLEYIPLAQATNHFFGFVAARLK